MQLLSKRRNQLSPTKTATGPLAEVRVSPVAGRGVFATRAVKAGTVIMPVTGRQVRRQDIDWATYTKKILQIDDDLFLEETGQTDDYINHSCEPSLIFSDDGSHFIALRDIAEGEELFFDYGTSENDTEWREPCYCGKPSCRGVMTGFSGFPPDVQQRLLPFCLPYIRRKFL